MKLPKKYEIAQNFDAKLPHEFEIARNFDARSTPSNQAEGPVPPPPPPRLPTSYATDLWYTKYFFYNPFNQSNNQALVVFLCK